MVGPETPKERLMQQFIDNRPLGSGNLTEDLEDFENELDFMLSEGMDLTNVTVRTVVRRMGENLRA